jgi:hypothetical protein
MSSVAGTSTPEHSGAAQGTDSFPKGSTPGQSGSVLASKPGAGESGGAPGKPVAPGTGGQVAPGVGGPFAK